MNLKLLEALCGVSSTSGNESEMKNFILQVVKKESPKWKCEPQVIEGEGFQDNLMLVFGNPSIAFYSHMDTVGFTTRYQNQMVTIGSPEPKPDDVLVGEDSMGPVECSLKIEKNGNVHHQFGRSIEPGTPLTYKPNFKQKDDILVSQGLDNRVGIFVLLELASTLENGALVFTTYEEHGGGSAGYLGDYLYKTFGITKSLIVDVTWATDGVHLGRGPVVSLRDAYIPRRIFVKRILNILEEHCLVYQKEVEGSGGSDGSELQKSALPVDWCFLGVASNYPHSSHEEVNVLDVTRLISVLEILSKTL
ncbi:MAG: aminopeptidase [Cyclobacteriaceae bacterium]|nr:aminopeptidase [Cyclobacteriaceae bacterium]